MVTKKRIAQDIEDTADFYEPAVYELLSFYHALETQPEPLDGQFIPLSGVQFRSPKDVNVMAVGFVPPSSDVTGRILDRSASVRSLDSTFVAEGPDVGLEAEDEVADTDEPTSVKAGAGLVPTGKISSPFSNPGSLRLIPPGPAKRHAGIDIRAELGADVRAAADGTVVTVAPDGVRDRYGNCVLIEHADGRVTVYGHLKGFAPGLSVGKKVVGGEVIGYVGTTHLPGPPVAPHLHFEVLEKNVPGGPGTPRPQPLAAGAADKINAPDLLRPARISPEVWLKLQGRSVSDTKDTSTAPVVQVPFVSDSEPATNWVELGAISANEASKTTSQVAAKSLRTDELEGSFLEQQRVMINQMRQALELMARTPPLRMLVNPQSFQVTAEKLIADGNWGRNGPIVEHWGDNQDKIEASGKVAAFFAQDANNPTGPGLSRTARQFSKSYQNLLSLWLIYKNNGGIWFPDPLVPGNSRAKNLSVVGSIYLYYDKILYIGSFDSFTLTETDSAPFTLEYSFSFTVRSWYLLDHFEDNQYMYGKPTVPSVPTSAGGNPLMAGNTAPQPSPNVALPPPALPSNDGLGPVGPNDFTGAG
jgi:murein DD-endopeptidase MepM/ murein hydrolase activator NlpD